MTWKERQQRRDWARHNPDKVRESNRKWRAGKEGILRYQARERMRRYRAALATSRNPAAVRTAPAIIA
jgi:hypothetical protein